MTEINFNKVDLNIKNNEVLKDINLDLEGGKVYGLLGRNGAGKTTLLSLVASYREVMKGELTIDGEDPFENEKMMDYVQFSYAYDYSENHESVEDTIHSYAKYKPNFNLEYANQLLKKFHIDTSKEMDALSRGQQSAVDAIIGLATGAPITMFDEVTSGMDAPTREDFYKEVLKMKENTSNIVILSTHIVSEMDYLFDEVIIIHHGAVMFHEPIDVLLSKGFRVTGPEQEVQSFTENLTVLNSETLGPTRSEMIFGKPDLRSMEESGLDFSEIKLQELFIYLTRDEEDEDE